MAILYCDTHVAIANERFTRYADPLQDGESGTVTTLDEHVDTVRDRLVDVGDGALDVGVLVNVLNAAGIAVYPDYVHALSADQWDETTIEAALDVLDGVGRRDGDATFRARASVSKARSLLRHGRRDTGQHRLIVTVVTIYRSDRVKACGRSRTDVQRSL